VLPVTVRGRESMSERMHGINQRRTSPICYAWMTCALPFQGIPLSKNTANLSHANEIFEYIEKVDNISEQAHCQRVCRVAQAGTGSSQPHPILRTFPIRWMICVDLHKLVDST
jgi:hypothetical protein